MGHICKLSSSHCAAKIRLGNSLLKKADHLIITIGKTRDSLHSSGVRRRRAARLSCKTRSPDDRLIRRTLPLPPRSTDRALYCFFNAGNSRRSRIGRRRPMALIDYFRLSASVPLLSLWRSFLAPSDSPPTRRRTRITQLLSNSQSSRPQCLLR